MFAMESGHTLLKDRKVKPEPSKWYTVAVYHFEGQVHIKCVFFLFLFVILIDAAIVFRELLTG